MIDYKWDFSVIKDYYSNFLWGTITTLEISILGIILGFIIGYLFAYIRTHRIKILSSLVLIFVEVIRNTPFLVQVYVVYFVLPSIGIKLNPLTAGIVAISLNIGGYATEIIRAGIESIPKDQIDAGLSLGMNRIQVFKYISSYQVLKKMFPALTSLFIVMMLGSSMLSAISTPELTSEAYSVTSYVYHNFEVFLFVAVIYFFLSLVLSSIFKIIEIKYFSREERLELKLKDIFKIKFSYK